ncbi:ABC transporter permease [Sphingomonas sp. HDW15A]|uniref:ABC transporter permease n=1 Tax=Sphingomonas sp. HDW15A TaxID=2714942 RepID=UPI00140D7F5D|nr:ABC transporter permease [Sphingomonas sp. HDW15A]QIK95147.1 ABC transporter permease [Sphingomonas sp. HDW15A]
MTVRETLGAAYVIGRRDFKATVFSKTFLLFLLGPLLPLVFGFIFGGIGAQAERNETPPTVAVIAQPEEFALIDKARTRFEPLEEGRPLVHLRRVAPDADVPTQRDRLLAAEEEKLLGVLEGGLKSPHFTGAVNADGRTVKQIALFVDEAQRMALGAPVSRGPPVKISLTDQSGGSLAFARTVTARAGQFLIFFLTVFLAGMLLSQLIEEKSNKVIEVLAAAVPVDSIFIGKLFAMLAMSLVGIAVWLTAGAVGAALFLDQGLGSLPPPAVGWPVFVALGFLYFTTNYLLIGAVFLGIGSQASTVREVQTLSMPVTMAQVLLFGFAVLGVGQPMSAEAIGAAIFPLSSAYAMIARAAEEPLMWTHISALAWQILWVMLILRLSARLFRRSVLKSGPAFRWPWQKRAAV